MGTTTSVAQPLSPSQALPDSSVWMQTVPRHTCGRVLVPVVFAPMLSSACTPRHREHQHREHQDDGGRTTSSDERWQQACWVDSSEVGERTASSIARVSRSSWIACHLPHPRPTASRQLLCSCTRSPWRHLRRTITVATVTYVRTLRLVGRRWRWAVASDRVGWDGTVTRRERREVGSSCVTL